MTAVSIDGELVAPENARVSIFDRGFLYGDGLFEVFRTWGGVATDLDAHLDRLYASARALELRAIARDRLAASVHATVEAAILEHPGGRAGAGEHRVRVVLTRGAGALRERLGDLGPGRAIVVVEPLPPRPAALTAITVDFPLPRSAGHKTLAYLDHLLARELAAAAGADEAIRLDGDGRVAEGATSNVFVVAGGAVATPVIRGGMLPGVTRSHVLACCNVLGIAARERPIARAELAAADEVFATSALRGVVPITRLDDRELAAGSVTKRLADAYDERLAAL